MYTKRTIISTILAATLSALNVGHAAAAAGATDEQAAAKKNLANLQEDFLKLKFGMFIHYNMATYKGQEWVEGYPAPSDFNPGGKVDTDAWADAAKAAGMKYAVLTTKHVGGFCLWDSKYTTYDIMHPDCPYKQDLVGQFVKSFTSRGLKVGLYYCWRHPGFDAGKSKGKFKVLPPECDPATHSLEQQIEFQKKQVAELAEKYPEAFYIWNDALDTEIMPAEKAAEFVRGLRPDLIACGNWWDWSKKGSPYLDLVVTELKHSRERQKEYKYVAGETCFGLERKWFQSGGPIRDATNAIHHIMTANGRKKNFLLNVGPDKKGNIHPDSVQTLKEIGEMWIPIEKILDAGLKKK
jgi:alpha-L-fucosidase